MIPLYLTSHKFRLFGILALLAGSSGAIWASGSYMVHPVRPPGRLVEDSQKYELGKSIFFGKAALREQASADRGAQRSLLTRIQEILPARVKKTVDLPGLTGKLSDEQLIALHHFLRVRYKID